jgi:NAD(P)-dependent dehydrogenase (short-subunit alcohol dehydrogenase family)
MQLENKFMVEEFDLSGKIALVVGAGKSWLEPIAISLLEARATVTVLSQGKTELALLTDLATKLNRQVRIVKCDSLNSQTVNKIVEEEISDWGKIDILVNSLNIRFAKPLLKVNETEWQKILNTNLTTLFTTCQTVGRHMLKQRAGRVINITSCLGERGLPHCTAYCAAAGGVIQFTRALALEWAKSGITANVIALGWIFEPPEIPDERLIRYIPMRRHGRPGEFTTLILYLASSASNYITGQIYSVDGGTMAHS